MAKELFNRGQAWPIGKHKSTPLYQVPKQYLEWCKQNVSHYKAQELATLELFYRENSSARQEQTYIDTNTGN